MPRNKHATLLSLFISVSLKCRFTGVILFAIFPNDLRDGLSFVDDAEFYTPVNPIPEKTLVWILIRHAAPFLQHLGTNCVELLIWSQVSCLCKIRKVIIFYRRKVSLLFKIG